MNVIANFPLLKKPFLLTLFPQSVVKKSKIPLSSGCLDSGGQPLSEGWISGAPERTESVLNKNILIN
jgi:hypothetical protein